MDNKRRTVLELMKLGMEFDRAAIIAECDVAEIEILRNDTAFQAHVKACSAILERDLLKSLNEIRVMNAATGNSTEVRWMLERINPKRWDKSGAVRVKGKQGEGDDAFSFVVEFVNGATED